MKELREDIRGEIKSELQGLFEQYLGSFTATPVVAAPVGPSQDRDKGMLGSSPTRFPLRDAPLLSPDVNMKNVTQGGQWDESVRSHRLGCPRFDGTDYQGWCAKLEQFFEAEGVLDHAKVHMVMLYLEGKALD